MNTIEVPPLGWFARSADIIMVPIMYLLSGTLSEAPQRTHRWNNMKLTHADFEHLVNSMRVNVDAVVGLNRRSFWGIPIFHLPIFGGWKNYVVLKPCHEVLTWWHVGWSTKEACGITRINLKGPVRVLLGQSNVSFFGIHSETGEQIPIEVIGKGSIGDEGPFSRLPLL